MKLAFQMELHVEYLDNVRDALFICAIREGWNRRHCAPLWKRARGCRSGRPNTLRRERPRAYAMSGGTALPIWRSAAFMLIEGASLSLKMKPSGKDWSLAA